jgi:hypothetical protein|tara:strand:- start:13557 stop:13850 length:294 start_codon:yes stop_codon:yes gene_type:complete
MFLLEGYEDVVVEAKLVYGKRGNKVVRKFRCTVGKRKGRVVSEPSQCSKPIDLKKRFTLKKTKARMGARIAKKAQRTKRLNPASRILRQLNKARGGR